jgi:predicted solute-binding protein
MGTLIINAKLITIMSDKSEEQLQITNPLLEINNKNLEETSESTEKIILSDEEKFNLMKEIEIKTEKKMVELYETGQLIPPLPIALGAIEITPEVGKQQMDLLEKTMQVGADEFKQKMGRNMTYSEMRMMFG